MAPELPDPGQCTGCSACFAACGKQAIRMLPDAEGFLHPQIDAAKCVGCGMCSRSCPVLKAIPSFAQPLRCYIARCRPLAERRESASGGAFASVARRVLGQGGVVYGAAFSGADWSVSHVRVTSLAELTRLQGSKYVQSAVGDVYRQVRGDLRAGKRVLFSGTPCQVAGLKGYLGGSADRLLLSEVVCNSVPSPAWWKACVSQISKGRPSIEAIRMRGEDKGRRFLLQVKYSGKRASKSFRFLTQLYSMIWMNGWACRPCCLDCRAKGRSGADLSFGDAWGVQCLAPWGDDGRGLSEIVCWTAKGHRAVSDATAQLEVAEIPFERALEGNRWIRHSLTVKQTDRLLEGRAELFSAIASMPTVGGGGLLWQKD